MLKNDVLIRALRREHTSYTPVWIMRQAGRYLPEYNRTRAKAGSFLKLCKNPDLCTEVTLQPLARFPLDAAIIFSDILTIPDAMGLGLEFIEGEGPRFRHPVREESQVRRLAVPDPEEDLKYVLEAIAQVKRALDGSVPLIGFSGSPFTLACYMVEGGAGSDFRWLKTMLYSRPGLLHRLLETNCTAITAYLEAQVRAGADVLMIFDTWGGILSAAAYFEFSLPYIKKILDGIASSRVPVIVFTKGGGLWLEHIAEIGCDAVGIDWTLDIGMARRRVGHLVALQGNLDPAALFGQPAQIRENAHRILESFGTGPGHVFNLGHGVSQFTDPDHLAALIEAVHELSRQYHAP